MRTSCKLLTAPERPSTTPAAIALSVALLTACGGGGDGVVETDFGASATEGVVSLPFDEELLGDTRIATLGRRVDDVVMLDADGNERPLLAGRDEALVVIAFTQVGCPVARRYGPRLRELHARYADRGVAFVGVDGSPQDDLAEIEEQRAELDLPFAFLKDERQELVRQLDVLTTTEVLVLDRERRIRYRGAVADQFEVDLVRAGADAEYLDDALAALLDDRGPAVQFSEAPGCLITRRKELESAEPLPDVVTYHEHVEPILQRSCMPCHREGQIGPFALETYDDAYGWSAMIGYVLEERIMPPWPVESIYDDQFHGERRLTDRERALLLAWTDSDAERGDPAAAPSAPVWPGEWALDDLDAVVEADLRIDLEGGFRRVPLPRAGYEVARDVDTKYVELATTYVFEQDVWIEALEVQPTAREVVHHILVSTVRARRGRGRQAQAERFGPRQGEAGYLGLFVPGSTPTVYPEGYAKFVPAGSALRFSVHYTPDGAEHHDRPRVGLRFAESPPEHVVRTGGVLDKQLDILPGDARSFVRASVPITEDGVLLTVAPHMHYRGARFDMFLRDPEGRLTSLVGLDWDFDWQGEYRLREPLGVRAGSEIVAAGWFDNSKANRANPDPSARVRWGARSDDEMFVGYFDFAARIPAEERRATGGRSQSRGAGTR